MKTKLLIFGITGDLGTRKLLPALEQIIGTGDFNDLSIIGVSRHDVNVDELLSGLGNKDLLLAKLSMFKMNLDDDSDYRILKGHLALAEDEQLLIYLAVPPKAVSEIVEHLGEAGLNTPNVKILFEKPFGTDYESAKIVTEQTAKYYDESQVYRIDHFLAKEMAQNIVAFRGRNALFNDIWNKGFISSIEITSKQKIGIEGRVHFYEQTGALRDLVQGHLMLLLTLVLMDIPDNFEWNEMPRLRLEALNHLEPANPAEAVRGQYQGYKAEVGNPDSKVETFVRLKLRSNQENWKDVPISLVTGKALNEEKTEIKIRLKSNDGVEGNSLVFTIQPVGGIDIEIFAKKPGYGREFETRHLCFNYPEDAKLPEAYEQVLVDAIMSEKSLFTGSGEVIRSWEILQPLLDAWKNSNESPKVYPVGSDVSSIISVE